MDEYQNRRDIDKIYDDLYDSINGSLNVVAFTNESKYKNISSKSDGSDRGTIDAIIDYYDLTNKGGGGSVIGTGSFSINNQGHLIVELPNAVDNPYFIDNNGHLIYDTSNTHNGS